MVLKRIASLALFFLTLNVPTCSEERSTEAPARGVAAPPATQLRPVRQMTMRWVPAGEVEMGSGATGSVKSSGSLLRGNLTLHLFSSERPAHTVYLDGYWIDRTEVTVRMFRESVRPTGYVTGAERESLEKPWRDAPQEPGWLTVEGTDGRHPQGPDSAAEDCHPGVQASWPGARAYCERVGGQLPWEVRWEKAARGSDGRTCPWGDRFDATRPNHCGAHCPVGRWRGQSCRDGFSFTASVGNFPSGASPDRVVDRAGNGREWQYDGYDGAYSDISPAWSPSGPISGTRRAMRGRAWNDEKGETSTLCAVRHQNPPWDRYEDVGTRCVTLVR